MSGSEGITRGSDDVFSDIGLTPAQTILTLIRNVTPTDEKQLDEIDGRVWYFIRERPFRSLIDPPYVRENHTRSRDVLKSIRPKGWFPISIAWLGDHWFVALGGAARAPVIARAVTEELAELDATIQAIEWERAHAS